MILRADYPHGDHLRSRLFCRWCEDRLRSLNHFVFRITIFIPGTEKRNDFPFLPDRQQKITRVSDQFQRQHPLLDRLVSIEAFLTQVVVYLLIWLLNDYLAVVLSLILGGIALSVYLISKIVELVERSRVPRVYYRFMVVCFVAPAIAAVIGLLLRNGLSWVN